MKAIWAAALVLLAACTFNTEHGKCIGAFDDGDPSLRYETDTWNVVWGVLFAETVVVPVVVIAKCTRCPTGPKPVPAAKP